LNNWRRDFSDNETINIARALIPRFLIWKVWKEHNNRIFKDKNGPVSSILALILKQFKETVNTLGGFSTGKHTGHREAHILERLELQTHIPLCLNNTAKHTLEGKAF